MRKLTCILFCLSLVMASVAYAWTISGTGNSTGGSLWTTIGPNNTLPCITSTGTATYCSSFTRIVTGDQIEVSTPGTPSAAGAVMFTLRDAIEGALFSAATNTTGLSVGGVAVQKCGTVSWASCTSMLSSALTPSTTTPSVASMATTTAAKGEKMRVIWTTVSGAGSLATKLTFTATGVE